MSSVNLSSLSTGPIGLIRQSIFSNSGVGNLRKYFIIIYFWFCIFWFWFILKLNFAYVTKAFLVNSELDTIFTRMFIMFWHIIRIRILCEFFTFIIIAIFFIYPLFFQFLYCFIIIFNFRSAKKFIHLNAVTQALPMLR